MVTRCGKGSIRRRHRYTPTEFEELNGLRDNNYDYCLECGEKKNV